VRLRILHLTGSPTSAFFADLSRLYAQDCLGATADPARYEFYVADVGPDQQWRFPTDLSATALAAAPPMRLAEAVRHLVALDIDVAIPQMFCLPGMTTYRALLDLLGIPYVGNTPDVMALGAHKARAKAVVAAAGVRVPAGEVLRAGQRPSMATPAVVKPVDADNSVGVSLVRDPAGYPAALQKALAPSGAALVETYIELGREVRCGILEREGELVCLPLEEYAVDPVRTPVRGQADKISRGDTGDLNLVAKVATRAWIVGRSDPLTEVVWDTARRCHVALGCRHYSLFDFRIDPEGGPWFLEAGLYCSFAEKSVIAVMAKAASLSVRELFDTAVGQSAGRGGPRRAVGLGRAVGSWTASSGPTDGG
jgi:D-alanine-D-alanine ligase